MERRKVEDTPDISVAPEEDDQANEDQVQDSKSTRNDPVGSWTILIIGGRERRVFRASSG